MSETSQLITEFANQHNITLAPLDISDFIAYNTTSDDIITLLQFAKEHVSLKFTLLTDLFAADFPMRSSRFEVVYHLLSLKLNQRLLVKIQLAENQSVPTASCLFNAACWYEREIFDMYGVTFSGATDLRRILTDYGFIGHPLRKDFPLTGHLQVKYDPYLEQVIYEPVLLEQEFRNFDFGSPWHGPSQPLPGDEKATKAKI